MQMRYMGDLCCKTLHEAKRYFSNPVKIYIDYDVGWIYIQDPRYVGTKINNKRKKYR